MEFLENPLVGLYTEEVNVTGQIKTSNLGFQMSLKRPRSDDPESGLRDHLDECGEGTNEIGSSLLFD
ncbi:hypothetical protein CVCC1112_203 [Paenarthrobacter nicotinovorans]|nr:hypothetical protein CVCC1112_203 [Paenarthrobacter nicotinovorans]